MNGPSRRVALTGILFALALALSFLEGMVPIPVPVPGVKLGLSNIVVMYCVYAMGAGQAYLLGVLKALFVLMTRGMSGALLSLSGGLLSITVMVVLRRFVFRQDHYTAISIGGAVAHNIGQLICAALLLGESVLFWYYLPVLAAVGVLVGALTAVLLRNLLPVLAPFRTEPSANQ